MNVYHLLVVDILILLETGPKCYKWGYFNTFILGFVWLGFTTGTI